MELHRILGVELPVIQAPMAGVQDSALAIAVAGAGGLGSLPCAMLDARGDPARSRGDPRRGRARRSTSTSSATAAGRRPGARGGVAAGARAVLPRARARHRPAPVGGGRLPFDAASAGLVEELRPAGRQLPLRPAAAACSTACERPARASSPARRRVDEARWLEARGVDAVIAQGLEAGGHRGHFLADDLSLPDRHLRAAAAGRRGRARAGDRRRRHRRPGRRRRPRSRSARRWCRSAPPSCAVPKRRRARCIAPP